MLTCVWTLSQLNSLHKKTKPIYNFKKFLRCQQMAMSKQKYFLCSHMPYPKKTNTSEIWSLQTQAIVFVCVCVCVCECVCFSLCLPFLLSKHLMHTDTAAAKFIPMRSEKKKSRVDMDRLEEQFETHGWLLILESLLILQVFLKFFLSESAFFWFTGLSWDTFSVSCLYFLFISGNDSAHSRRETQEMYLFSFWYGVSWGTEPRREGMVRRAEEGDKIKAALLSAKLTLLQNESLSLFPPQQNPYSAPFFFCFVKEVLPLPP